MANWKTVERAAPEKLLDRSVNDLRKRYADMSASRTLSRGQLLWAPPQASSQPAC
jgi:hypothetical protein